MYRQYVYVPIVNEFIPIYGQLHIRDLYSMFSSFIISADTHTLMQSNESVCVKHMIIRTGRKIKKKKT